MKNLLQKTFSILIALAFLLCGIAAFADEADEAEEVHLPTFEIGSGISGTLCPEGTQIEAHAGRKGQVQFTLTLTDDCNINVVVDGSGVSLARPDPNLPVYTFIKRFERDETRVISLTAGRTADYSIISAPVPEEPAPEVKPEEKPEETDSQTTEPTEETAEETAETPEEEPAEEAAAEIAEEPAEEPADAQITEPAEEPANEQTVEPAEESVNEQTEEPAEKPEEEPVEKPAEESAAEPEEESDKEPAEESEEGSAEEPIGSDDQTETEQQEPAEEENLIAESDENPEALTADPEVQAEPIEADQAEQQEPAPETTETDAPQESVAEPAETEAQPETTEEKSEEQTEQAEGNEEETVESPAVRITQVVLPGESWSGTLKRKSETVLKLDVSQPQMIYMLVEGKHVWSAVQRMDEQAEDFQRNLTDSQTDQSLISWNADEEAYLIRLGANEKDSLAARVTVTFITEQEWEKQSELASETEQNATQTEPVTDQPEDIPGEETTEPVQHETESAEEQPEAVLEDETDDAVLLPENAEADFTISWDDENPTIGSTAHFKAAVTGCEGFDYTLQWQRSLDCEAWEDVPDATEADMDVLMTEESSRYYWRVKVYIQPANGE